MLFEASVTGGIGWIVTGTEGTFGTPEATAWATKEFNELISLSRLVTCELRELVMVLIWFWIAVIVGPLAPVS